jgi:hypothetical protein
MGIERMHSPKYRRDRAEELRAKTNNCAYAETRDALRTAAKSYDDLARTAEEIRRTAEARVVAEEARTEAPRPDELTLRQRASAKGHLTGEARTRSWPLSSIRSRVSAMADLSSSASSRIFCAASLASSRARRSLFSMASRIIWIPAKCKIP